MRIGIVGLGEVGSFYAQKWARSGHDLYLTYFRERAKAEKLCASLEGQARVVAMEDLPDNLDAVLLCPRFEHISDAAAQLGALEGVILIDANNPFNPERTGKASMPAGETAVGNVGRRFPKARLVKAFHNLGIKTIQEDPTRRLAAFIASDDPSAAEAVGLLAVQAGLLPVLTGGLATAPLSEFPGPLFGHAMGQSEAERALGEHLRERGGHKEKVTL